MAKHHCPYFIKLDEDILQDPEVQNLLEEKGFEGLGVYLSILTLFRAYESEGYMIPYKDLKRISKKTFEMSEKKLLGIVETCIENNLLDRLTNLDGKDFLYNKRRKEELIGQKELKQKQSEGGIKGMSHRYRA